MGTDNLHHIKKKGQPQRGRSAGKGYNDSILIVCEGEETEPRYFKKFPINNIKVETLGIGRSNIALIEAAVDLWKEKAEEGKIFEKLWCVFDRDDFPLEKYNEAFERISAEEKKLNRKYLKQASRKVKIGIAYSNQAFELWYLLHYDYIDTGLSRSQYEAMLGERMQKTYKKNDPHMYGLLKNLQVDAIRNAKRLEASISRHDKHNHNPSTSVYNLVEDLNHYLS